MSSRELPSFSADDYRLRQSARRAKFILLAFVLSVAFTVALIRANGNVLVPFGAMMALLLIGLAWQFPRVLFYVMLVGSTVIEIYQQNFKDSTTDLIPLFWDVNTVVQTYLKIENFHLVPFSFFEILLMIAGFSWLVRGIFFHTLKMNIGTLLPPILLYVVCVFCGLLNGLSTGGQFTYALFEVRAQFYLLFAYLMTVNSGLSNDKLVATVMWGSALGIGLKGVLASYRFIFTLKGVTIPEIGIGAHEESFFFNCFVFELLVLKIADIQPKLRSTMLWLLPFVVLGNLANERRAATAAMAIALIMLLVLAAISFPKRRVAIGVTAIIMVVVMSIYLPIFWNGTGTLAQPARAIKSQFSPDPRDASSNEYRDAENTNLMYTMRASPIIGYGYGKPIREITTMVDLTTIDPFVHYMTHNQILWVWMRLGAIGFYAFWLMITSTLIQAARLLRHPVANAEAKAAGLLCILIVVMELIFGLLDLQLSNVRNMLYCGIWAGVVSILTQSCGVHPVKVIEKLSIRGNFAPKASWKLPPPEQTLL